jgi:serine protease
MRTRGALLLTISLAAVTTAGSAAPARAEGPTTGPPEAPFVSGEVIVRYEGEAGERLVQLLPGVGVPDAVRELRQDPGVAYANPNFVATAAQFVPDDPGSANPDWRTDQWNFVSATAGVRALDAWAHLIAAGRPGARRVKVAVLDSGVAYRDKGRRFRHNPDLPPTKRFVHPKDFVAGDRVPLDQSFEGHGTHVTGTIAQATNNGLGLTGLAYGVRVMPVRVLDRTQRGNAHHIAKGIRFADRHGADVINLSLQFGAMVDRCADIRGVCRALRAARRHGAVILAAAGNAVSPRDHVTYPAALDRAVLGVGATTNAACLADYSNFGEGLDLVAPGGGISASLPGCLGLGGRRVRQYSIRLGAARSGRFNKFGIVGLEGTSMATAHASGAAALLLAEGMPPASVGHRLKCTARTLGDARHYGAGLLDAGVATDPAATCP